MNDVEDTRREFRPALVPTLLTVALMPVLIGLGVWQLSRYEYKTELEQAYTASGAEPAAADAVTGDDRDRFRPVAARGRYDSERQFLIDNMVSRGRNGFFVITPLRLESGGLLLVNRGWIAQDARRRPADDIAVNEETRRIEGRVGRLPVAGLDLGGDGAAGGWPSLRQFPDIRELSAALAEPVEPWVLLLSPEAADGFRREWEPGGLPATRHLGYAVQWFALATALAVIYVVVNIRRRPRAASDNE